MKYDLYNNYINTYESIADAAKSNNIDYRTISKNINGKLKTGRRIYMEKNRINYK